MAVARPITFITPISPYIKGGVYRANVGDYVSIPFTQDHSGVYTISGVLPAGLSFDSKNYSCCFIEGTITIDALVNAELTAYPVTITCVADGDSASCTITFHVIPVTAVKYICSPIKRILMDPKTLCDPLSTSIQVTPFIVPQTAVNKTVTWNVVDDESNSVTTSVDTTTGVLSIYSNLYDQMGRCSLIGTASDGFGATVTIEIYSFENNSYLVKEPKYSAKISTVADPITYSNAPCYALIAKGSNIAKIKKVTGINSTIFAGTSPSYNSYAGFTSAAFKHNVTFSDNTTGIVLDDDMFDTYDNARIGWQKKYEPEQIDPW